MKASRGAAEHGFREVQRAFTAHVRDPDVAAAPSGVEDRRMGIYRDLLYNNVESFLANSFPVLRKIHEDGRWHALIRDYFRTHRAHTPLFPRMPQEFLQYLVRERGAVEGDFPFLAELAHYEWVEIALSLDTRDIDSENVDAGGDLLAGVPVLSPLAWPLAFAFPVHRIRPEHLPAAAPPAPTYLVVYRDRQDRVGFLELNPVTARLVELVREDTDRPGRDLLRQIAGELRHPDPDGVVTAGDRALQELRDQDIVLGTRRA
jgi:hypothetical protein